MSKSQRHVLRRLAALACATLAGTGLLVPALLVTASPAGAVATSLGSKTLADSFASVLALPKVSDRIAYTSPSMTVAVWIPGDTAGLEAYAAAVTSPRSPDYGYTLSPAEVNARFGVSKVVSAETQKSLEAYGLKPVYVAGDGQYVELSGSSAAVERTFGVALERVTIAGKNFFANSDDAIVPASVGAVIGLSNFTDMQVSDSQDLCDTGTANLPVAVPVSAAKACVGTTTGQDLAGIYDAPVSAGGVYDPTDTKTDYGQGQRIAIFGEGNVNDVVRALRQTETTKTFPQSTELTKALMPQVPVREVLVNDPQNASSDTSGEDEFDLDSQSSTEMSPLLSELDFYFGNSLSDQSIGGTFSAWVNDTDGPAIANISVGGCEPLEYISGGETTDDALLAEGVAEGRSMFVSSGDAGAGGCQTLVNAGQPGVPAVEDPASSAFVTAVGGTVVYSQSTGTGAQAQPPTRDLEYGWNDSTGGYADFSAMPADQAAVVAGTGELPAALPCVGVNVTTCNDREVPDVSSMSGDEATDAFAVNLCTGTAACTEADVVGTSLASPTWAGMWARVTAAHNPATASTCTTVPASSGASLNFAQPDLYQLAGNPTLDAKDFFNVGGTTNSIPTSNYAYTSMPRSAVDTTGYSLVTGLGTPDISKMITDLDCGNAPVAAATPGTGAVTTLDAATIGSYSCQTGQVVSGATPETLGGANDPGLQLKTSQITGDATGATFTITTQGPPTSAGTDDSFVTIFGVNGVQYAVDVDPGGEAGYGETGVTDTPGTPAFHLLYLDLDVVAGMVPVFLPKYLANLTGTASPSTGTYSIRMPYSVFNTSAASVAGFQALSPASYLDPVELLAGNQPAFATTAAQQVSNNTVDDTLQYHCAQYLMPAAVGQPVVVTTPSTTTTATTSTVVMAPKKTRRVVTKAVHRKPTQPERTLAFTGLSSVLPGLGLALLLGSGLMIRGRRNKTS